MSKSKPEEDKKKIGRRRFLRTAGIISGIVVLGSSTYFLASSSCKIKIFGDRNLTPHDDFIGLMTHNLANARGYDQSGYSRVSKEKEKNNLDKTTELCLKKKASIISLNEVEFGFSIRTSKNQAEYIAKRLSDEWGVAYLIEGINTIVPGFRLGNALISKYPITHYKNKIFSSFLGRLGHQFKGYLDTIININNKQINVIATHLYHGDIDTRLEEASSIVNCLEKKIMSTILMGDLNSHPEDAVIEKFSEVLNPVELDFVTFPTNNPQEKLDYIFTSSDLHVFGEYVEYSKVSDHLALGCYIDLNKTKRK